MPPPNEQLYSSLYGREMEMMRKMFKTSDDRLDNPMMLSGVPASAPGNLLKNFHPNYPNIFPQNNSKYFEPPMMRFEPSPADKMRKHDPKTALYPIGHPLFTGNRQPPIHPINTNNSQLYDDVAANKHHQGLLKPLFDDKQHPHFNVNFNNKTETSLLTKSYSGFDNSLSNNDTTNHNNLLLSESQFVSHNFNVNNYTNRSDKSHQSTFLNNRGNHSPSDFVNATNNNSSEFDLNNKSGDNNVGGMLTTQLKVTSNNNIKCADTSKEFGNGNVSGINFDDEKSRNSSNDNDDDEFTNL